jgi:5-methylcytosine-specific restriction protein A
MSRTTVEWIGRTDDEAIPPRVKVRVFGRAGGRCAQCGRQIAGSIRPTYDHIIPLIVGGGNRESNLQLLCVSPCHAEKTRADVAEKSMVARKRMKHLGIAPKRQKNPVRRIPQGRPATHGNPSYRTT